MCFWVRKVTETSAVSLAAVTNHQASLMEEEGWELSWSRWTSSFSVNISSPFTFWIGSQLKKRHEAPDGLSGLISVPICWSAVGWSLSLFILLQIVNWSTCLLDHQLERFFCDSEISSGWENSFLPRLLGRHEPFQSDLKLNLVCTAFESCDLWEMI